MSETDDCMERAERIRKMRQSREPDDNDGADDGEQAETTTPTGTADDGVSETGDTGATSTVAAASDASDSAAADTTAGGSETTTADQATAVDSAEAAVGPTNREPSGGGLAPLGGADGFSLPGQDELESAAGVDGAGDADSEGDANTRTRGTATAATEPSVRVLEFTVGDQVYCIDIERVEEIVKREEVTRVPNTDDYVEGVVDLRGQITTILDTKQLLDVETAGRESLLVIFAPDAFEEHGTVGWVVDEVRQVVPVVDSHVRRPPSEDDHVRGIVDREDEDELIVWIRPGRAMTEAVALGDAD